MNNDVLLRVFGVSKEFPGVKALDNVQFDVKYGEVHAICGENGAGKSTLINILAGNYFPDAGAIKINGEVVKIRNHSHSLELGISVVYQERSLVPNLSVAENIFANRQPVGFLKLINNTKMLKETEKLCNEIQLDVKPNTMLGSLSPAKQQMVEIAKALAIECRIQILDEPTATITENDIKILFSLIKKLKQKGIAIIYISHRLAEIFEISDRVTVLKDGKYVGTKNTSETNIDEVIKMMVGRDLKLEEYKNNVSDEVVFEVRKLCSSRFNNISFKLRKGEILGFSGLSGAGRTEVFRSIIGVDKINSGEILINGKCIKISNTTQAIKYGIGYLPEDRKEQGLFLEMSVANNIISGNLEAICKNKIINRRKILLIANNMKERLKIICRNVDKLVGELSGGNQQKVVFAKWLLVNPPILVIDEPTRGVDVGTKSEIYKIIKELTAKGTSIAIISSDLPEILSISDRIIVMHDGKITGEFPREEASEEVIMHCASGIK